MARITGNTLTTVPMAILVACLGCAHGPSGRDLFFRSEPLAPVSREVAPASRNVGLASHESGTATKPVVITVASESVDPMPADKEVTDAEVTDAEVTDQGVMDPGEGATNPGVDDARVPTRATDSTDVDHWTFGQEASGVEGGERKIDFATSLALAAGQNPRVAFAQERINEAYARFIDAKTLWLPSLRAGVHYNKHEGSIQDVVGHVFDTSRGSLYTGLGAQAVGAGSPAVPGISARFHLADAIFQPLIAERTWAAREESAMAAANDVMLRASLAHLELLRASEERAIASATLADVERLVGLAESFAESGQGTRADADRARTERALRQNQVARAEEAIAVAAARLAEALHLDLSWDLRPAEAEIVPIDLIEADSSARELVGMALTTRPELSEAHLLASAASQKLLRERFAPLVPSVVLNASYGVLGGGLGSTTEHYTDRLDLDAAAFWEWRNLGYGDRAARQTAYAQMRQAELRSVELMDEIAREVTETLAQVQSRKSQIAVAESAVKSARDSRDHNFERIHHGEGLPIEVLQSIQALDQAQREYLRTVGDFNDAQFRLHRALGWPIPPRQ